MYTRTIADLHPHPRNAAIYGDSADADLIESVRSKGILNPLLIAHDGTIISGHRRLIAAQRVGLADVPVVIYGSDDDLDILEALIESNRQREKTNYQVGREAAASLEIEHERARRRQAVRSLLPQNSAEVNGDARKIVADKLGMSHPKVTQAAAVVEVIDKLTEAGDTRHADQLRTVLNDKSVHAAYKKAKDDGHIAVADAETSKDAPAMQDAYTLFEWDAMTAAAQQALISGALLHPPRGKMNFQKTDNIEWAFWSWNPITGCYHDCIYCYARDIANRYYPQKFDAAILPHRLTIPRYQQPPTHAKEQIGYKNIFTCSMADLFGKWVPQPWIDAVLDTVRKSPQWNFLFLTKFPIRLSEQTWPDNAWVGCTVDRQARVASAERAFRKVKAGLKWLSCEPLLEPLTFTSLEMFDWIVIGGQTKSTQAPAFDPPWEWIESLVNQARAAGCKVYFKTNLHARPKEYPFSERGTHDDSVHPLSPGRSR